MAKRARKFPADTVYLNIEAVFDRMWLTVTHAGGSIQVDISPEDVPELTDALFAAVEHVEKFKARQKKRTKRAQHV